MAWVHWEQIVISEALVVWGLKKIFLFSKYLVTKVSWKLIQTESLWTRVVHQNYIAPLPMLEWIRLDEKMWVGCSVIWKELVHSFKLIRFGLVWRVGNGRQVWVSLDP